MIARGETLEARIRGTSFQVGRPVESCRFGQADIRSPGRIKSCGGFLLVNKEGTGC